MTGVAPRTNGEALIRQGGSDFGSRREATIARVRGVGLKIRSGFAVAVVVERRGDEFSVESRRVVALSSEELPQSRFPYHPTVEMPAPRGEAVSNEAVAAVRRTAAREMKAFLEASGAVTCAGVVVGSLVDPKHISNPHIRAHAQEGELFRTVVMEALATADVRCGVLIEKEAYDRVAADLSRSADRLRNEIAALGQKRIKPWRTEEKLATLAACWQLGQRPRR